MIERSHDLHFNVDKPKDGTFDDSYFSSLSLATIFNKNTASIKLNEKLIEEREIEPVVTWWLPNAHERALILQLASTLHDSESKPLIVDAACGTGFTDKVLALDGELKVVGIDLDAKAVAALSNIASTVVFHTGDVWDYINHFGPRYPEKTARERNYILDTIRVRTKCDLAYVSYHGVNLGDPNDLSEEVIRLQQLVALQPERSSPTDIVLCSFMPIGTELTIPIRDGIRPKAIVYIRPINGQSGAGDYYLEPDKSDELRYAVISYNPGENYRTVARWRTQSRLDWDFTNGRLNSDLTAEVVIQLRKDIVLQRPISIDVNRYPWDDELGESLRVNEKDGIFQQGIHVARESLFKA